MDEKVCPQEDVNVKRALLSMLGVMICAYGIYTWAPWKQDAPLAKQQPSIAVEIARVVAEPLDISIEAVGTLRANEAVTLRPEVSGRITEIAFEEGSPLKKGDVLFRIDNRLAAAEVKQAEANLRLAQLEYKRFSTLAKSGAATRRLYDQSQASLGVSQANLDLARAKLDYTTIRAPFDGVVGLRKVSPGDYVNVGQELANFVSYDPMKVDFSIPETQAGALKKGQMIEMTVEALPEKTFGGEVYALEPQADVSGRSIALRARAENPDNTLKPGYFARVLLEVEKKRHAMVIPEGAVVPEGDKTFAFVVRGDDTVTRVPITLGERAGDGRVEVLSGLAEGVRVVASGQMKLREGAAVKVVKDVTAPNAQAITPATELTPAGEP